MKKKNVLLNYVLLLAVLFSILFQSAHSYEHLAKQLSEKKCVHKYISSHEITHQHHNFDRCFICNFVFSNCVPSVVLSFEFIDTIFPFDASFYKAKEITILFKGSLFALRAPPVFSA